MHGAERMSLNAAHKAESGKPFARAAGAIFALFDRAPGLRSVIAPLRRNPKLNPAERHRIEREAVERRHQRERLFWIAGTRRSGGWKLANCAHLIMPSGGRSKRWRPPGS
jgi:hypothetical protein